MKMMIGGTTGRAPTANSRGVLRGLSVGFALLAALIPATMPATSAADVPRLMAIAYPYVVRIAPIQVTAGKETMLRLLGRSLSNGLVTSFSAGIRTEPTSRTSADGTQASLRIRIAPDARTGRRQMTLVVNGRRVTQDAYIIVQAPQVNISTFPRVSVKPKPAPAGFAPPVSILSIVTPSTVRVGDRVRLMLEGRNLMRGLHVDYGPGVRVESLRVLSARRAVAFVRIDATARPGRRMPRASEPDARVRVLVRAALELLAAPAARNHRTPPKSTGGFAPRVTNAHLFDVSPNRFEAGKDYRVTAYGRNLGSGLELRLGDGIRVNTVKVLDAHHAQVALHVDAKARPGTRRARIRAGGRGIWTAQPATILVERPFLIVSLPKPKIHPPNLKITVKGRILLQGPKWFSGLATKPAPKNPLTGKPMGPAEIVKTGVHVPTLKDDKVFTWREQNPGMAEWYEVRFYFGNRLVAKRHVGLNNKGALPTWLEPNPALIATLTRAASTYGVSVSRDAKTGRIKVSGVVQATPVWGGRKSTLPSSALTWEVVGYRRYFKSGIELHAALKARRPVMLASLSGGFIPSNDNLGTMVPREVERSERWPLNTPYRSTGLACGNEASSTLNVRRVDNSSTNKNKPFSNEIYPVAHTGDRWQLFGTMDLGRSPWSSEPSETATAVGHGKNKHFPSITWNFDNIYLDWGDGTVVPLAISKSVVPGRSVNLFDKHHDKLDLANNGITPHQHAYSRVGSYTVRIYQLAEGDIQNESAGNVSVAVNPRATLYGAARMAIGGGDNNRPDANTTPRSFHHARAVGNRAYMMLCKQVVIEARHDPASDGPLNLVAAKVRGFPEQAGSGTPPKGVSVASPLGVIKSLMPKPASGGGSPVARSSFKVGHLQTDQSAVHTGLPSRGITQVSHAKSYSGASFSTCDVALTGGGSIYYYGQGQVRTTWYVDGAPVGNSILPLGPSTPRSDRVLSGKHPGKPLVSASDLILSPSIPFDQLGRHRLSFDAEVIYDVRGLPKLASLMGQALGAGDRKPDRRLAAQLAAGLHGAPPLGVLPPRGVRFSGSGGPVAWLNQPLQRLAQQSSKPVQLAVLDRVMFDSGASIRLGGILHSARELPKGKPPAYVAAPARAYRVLGSKSDQPCTFRFPVKGGEFIVGGLQNAGKGKPPNVTRQGNKWSGHGKLFIKLAGGATSLPVPLKFTGWTLKDDAVTVSSGTFDLSDPIKSSLLMPGVGVRVQRLRGEAGKSVRMTLNARITNSNIVATDNQHSPPPLVATAVLSPAGDWYAGGLSLPKLDVYDSGFTLEPDSVALDFSASRGSGCDSGDNGWMGISMGDGSQLSAYTFELRKGQTASVSGWGINGEGLCGAANFGSYDAQVERGSIQWKSINAKATGGGFTAAYNGLLAHVPWLNTDLTSNSSQLLKAGKGSSGGKLVLNLTGDAPPRTFGPVTLDANALQFGTFKGVGWAVRAQSTLFSFRADGRTFAKDVAVPDLVFGMNGKAYFKEGGGTVHISLSGSKGRLSQGVVDLKGLDVIATPGKSSRLLFNFSTELRISDALPAAPAPVSYRIDEASAAKYTGSGPVTGKFVIHKPFPDANPSTDSVIHPDYVGPQGGHGAASGSHMSYCGKIDLGMFGGPPVKGGFALGYQGSDDFWAAGADVSMGPTGTPLVPPFMTLYTIGGGLGYNVALNSFTSGASCNVSAKIDHTPAFNAHIQVGDPTHFVYGFDGRFTVKVSGPEAGARMDYKAWMVSKKWDGPGNFHGHFLFANGNFDGTLNGKYSFLDDKVYIEAANDAISMHFGGGRWYIHAGTKPNPIKGHVLIVNAGAWLGIGSEGMYAGAKAHLNLGAGDCDAACARVIVDMLIAAEITPQPHISADADMHMDAHACALKICLGAGVGASMHVAALPPELAIGFRLGGCPPGHLNIGLRILPSPKPSIGGGLCLW